MKLVFKMGTIGTAEWDPVEEEGGEGGCVYCDRCGQKKVGKAPILYTRHGEVCMDCAEAALLEMLEEIRSAKGSA